MRICGNFCLPFIVLFVNKEFIVKYNNMTVWFLFHNSMIYVKFLCCILLVMALKTGVEADVETDKMIGKAVDTVVRDFMNVEKINTNPKNSFGY